MSRVVVCENLRSLHNVGAVFRTADAAGWDTVLLGGYTGCPPDRRIEKVSLGAENMISWKHEPDVRTALMKLKADGYMLLALELTDAAHDLFDYAEQLKSMNTMPEKLVLVLGNEVEGVEPETLAMMDAHVKISMNGDKASLNVSVACGIALYALRP